MTRNLLALGLLALFSGAAGAVCPGLGVGATCSAATRYDVNVQEVALCQDSACASSSVVGSGAKTFDIASAAVGTAIGSYAKVDALPVGVYSHIRVVISRTFTISGAGCTGPSGLSQSVPNGAPVDAITVANLSGISWNDPAVKTQIKIIQPLPTALAISKAGSRPAVTVKFATQDGILCAGGAPYPGIPDVTLAVD